MVYLIRGMMMNKVNFTGSSRDDLKEFQKKSKSGIRTAGQDVELIKRRLKVAEEDYNTHYM